jgi:hypothetical protein
MNHDLSTVSPGNATSAGARTTGSHRRPPVPCPRPAAGAESQLSDGHPGDRSGYSTSSVQDEDLTGRGASDTRDARSGGDSELA